MKKIILNTIFISGAAIFAVGTSCKKQVADLSIPAGIPIQLAPSDNPFTEAKARLGRLLFYDKRLSGDETMSCASCHDVTLAFTDGKERPRGIPDRKGGLGPRNAPNLTNAGFTRTYTWINPGLKILESQAMVPLFLDNVAIEMGLASKEKEALEKLRKEDYYREMFQEAFPNDKDPFNIANVVRAIGSFERTFVSFNSAFDQFEKGDRKALSEKAKRGMDLFLSSKLKCAECHSGKFFTDAQDPAKERQEYLHDNGIHAKFPDASGNEGLSEVSLSGKDVGKFKTPTLRNVALTYPYMHDGSFSCDATIRGEEGVYSEACARQALGRVIDNYAAGGKKSPNQDRRITGFSITKEQKGDLIEFLLSLTDRTFVTNPFYQNPKPEDRFFGR